MYSLLQQEPVPTNNSAMSGQSTPAQHDKTKWQRVKISETPDQHKPDTERPVSTADSTSPKRVRFGDKLEEPVEVTLEDIQRRDKGKADSRYEQIDKEGSDHDVKFVESGNTEQDLAELYADLEDLDEEEMEEEIGDLRETLDEYLGLGVTFF